MHLEGEALWIAAVLLCCWGRPPMPVHFYQLAIFGCPHHSHCQPERFGLSSTDIYNWLWVHFYYCSIYFSKDVLGCLDGHSC